MEANLKEIFASYFAWKAKEDTWFISFMNGSQFLYLLEGEASALLVDTGYAVPGLRAFVETLTDKPVRVINTHFHPDHAGGNGEWEEVMMSVCAPKDFLSLGRTVGDPNALPYPEYKKVFVRDGDTIDLGGRSVEIMEAADCHSHSSLYLLDRSRRMLFMGDEMDGAQVIMIDNSADPASEAAFDLDTALQNYRSNLLRVKELDGAFDWLLANHNGSPLAKSYLDDYLGLIDAIYTGTAVVEDRLNHKFIEMDARAPQLCRVRYGKASIFVMKDQVMALYGTRAV